MKIHISRNELLPVLQAANNVVERRQTLPILSNLLFNAENDVVHISATDMEVELVCQIENKTLDAGSVAIPSRKLFDICRALPHEATLNIAHNGNKVSVTSGRSRFTLASMPAQDFPSIGSFVANEEFSLETAMLSELLESAHFSMAHQDVRYYLNGLLLELEAGRIRAVATDGHRLALTDKPMAHSVAKEMQFIIPRKGVLEILRLLNAVGETVHLRLGENHIQVRGEALSLTTKLVDGRFPDYGRVIPEECDKAVIANRESMRAGLSRASILSNEKFRGIRLNFKENILLAVAHNPEQEEAEEEIEVQYNGEPLEVGFNVSYLLDILGVMRTESVRVDINDANSSCLIRDPEDESSRYVVMPMRL